MFAEKPVIGAEEGLEELLDGSREGKPEINAIMSEKITSRHQEDTLITLARAMESSNLD